VAAVDGAEDQDFGFWFCGCVVIGWVAGEEEKW